MQPLLLVYRIVVFLGRRSGLSPQYRQRISASSLRSSPVSPVSVDPPELREVLRPPPLRVWGRLSLGRQRVNGFRDHLHQTVGLHLNATARRANLKRMSGTFSYRLPGRILEQQSWLEDVLWDIDVERCFDCTVVRLVLRAVNFSLLNARCEFRDASIRAIIEVYLLSCHVLVPRGSRLSRPHSPVKSIMGSASPCRWGNTSSPAHSWSLRLKSPATTTSSRGPPRRPAMRIASLSGFIVPFSGATLPPLTYQDATSTDRSGNRSKATVRSADGIVTCSHSMSLRTQSMLLTAHLPPRRALGTMAVQTWCPIETVAAFPPISKTYGSLTIKAVKSFKFASFIRLCWTFRCFCTFNCKNLMDLDISRR